MQFDINSEYEYVEELPGPKLKQDANKNNDNNSSNNTKTMKKENTKPPQATVTKTASTPKSDATKTTAPSTTEEDFYNYFAVLDFDSPIISPKGSIYIASRLS